MQKLLCTLFALFVYSALVAQVEMRTQKTSPQEFRPLPKTTFSVNPLGVLQFGPIGQGEFAVGDKSYVTAHVRLPYLGLLYHLITIDGRSGENKVSPVALGLGGGYKALFPNPKGAWYAGAVTDISFGSSSGSDRIGEWKSSFGNVALMGNGGFRWRPISKNSFIAVGAYVGVALPFKDEWWYKTSPENKEDEKAIMPMAMLELSFGWER